MEIHDRLCKHKWTSSDLQIGFTWTGTDTQTTYLFLVQLGRAPAFPHASQVHTQLMQLLGQLHRFFCHSLHWNMYWKPVETDQKLLNYLLQKKCQFVKTAIAFVLWCCRVWKGFFKGFLKKASKACFHSSDARVCQPNSLNCPHLAVIKEYSLLAVIILLNFSPTLYHVC